MDSRFPILDRIREASPQYGPGKMSVCNECVEKHRREADYDHRIADIAEAMPIPSDLMTDELRDLIKLRRAQR